MLVFSSATIRVTQRKHVCLALNRGQPKAKPLFAVLAKQGHFFLVFSSHKRLPDGYGPGDKGRRNNPGPAPHPNGRMRLPSGRLQGGELNPLGLPRKGVQCSSFGIRRENFELATRVGKTSDRALTDKLHRRLSMMGVEPISRAWEAVVLPAFARLSFRFAFRSGGQV